MGAIIFLNFHLLKLKIIAENQCEIKALRVLMGTAASKRSNRKVVS